MLKSKKNIILSITGASGSIYARQLIESFIKYKLQVNQVSIVFSDNALEVWKHELGEINLTDFPFKIYEKNDFNAPFASGSSIYDTQIIAPCSMGTLARISTGISNDLITRAADVILKERRKLILLVREMPFNLIHIENMQKITLAGGIICPAIPSFYSKPQTIEQLTQTVVDRILDLAGFEVETFRWKSL
jgi:4-hydroxy-3-polyprenylbenzoate decarboxylase